MEKLSVVIQAGGNSSRMGEDKALIKFHNVTLIEYILDQVKGLGEETIIISNKPDKFTHFGYKVFSDIFPDVGALGGIYTAIHYSSLPKCLLLACDMPFVNIPLIKYMNSVNKQADLIIPRLQNKSFAEPFRAIYSKECLPAIEGAIKKGKKRVNSFFYKVNIQYIEYIDIIKFDPDLLSFININTPEDLSVAEGLV